MATKRAAAEQIEPEVKKPQEKKKPILWTEFDAKKVNHALLKSGKYGFSGSRSYGDARAPLLIQCPLARVVFAPSVWNEEAEAKHGKPEFGKLDPNRKSDKWSMTLKFENKAFLKMMNEAFTAQMRDELFASRKQWGNGLWDALESPLGLFTKVSSPVAKSNESDDWVMKVTMRSARDAAQPDAAWFDWKNKELRWDTKNQPIGKETLVLPIIDFSDIFVPAKNAATVYAAGRIFYVCEYVAPRVTNPNEYAPYDEDDDALYYS